jgi:ABC-2 type transport system ATP-binding protein
MLSGVNTDRQHRQGDAMLDSHPDQRLDAPPAPAIVARGLTKRFGERTAVDRVNLEVPAGCAFGFLGPNGAGKTTMIRMLLGLTRSTSGTAALFGHRVPEQRAAALARVGAIVEEPRFHLHLSGRENLEIIAAVRGPEAWGRIDASLERVGLADRAAEKVRGYSLGMRQRLGVARGLLADPRLLILDEPTNGLDPYGIQELRAMIRSFVEEEGRTVFLSSHLLDEVEKVCDAVAIVERGRVVVQGRIDELTGGATRRDLILGVDDPGLAALTLEADPRVGAVTARDGALRVELLAGPESVAGINAALVHAGVGVLRLEPVHQTLEERFMQITSSLDQTHEEVAA